MDNTDTITKMDGIIDFEELIDVKPFLASVVDTESSQKSSQEHLGDVLDKMCRAFSESNIDIDNVLQAGLGNINEKVPDDPIIDLDEFERFLACPYADFERAEKIDNAYDLTNSEQDIIKAVMPYKIPIDVTDNGPTINENIPNELEKDEKVTSFLDIAVSYRAHINSAREKQFNMETSDVEKYEETVNLDCKIVSPSFTEDSDDGYDSSDFEFITENEATKAGIVTKSYNEPVIKPHAIDNIDNKDNTADITSLSTNTNKAARNNEASYSEYIKYSKYRYERCYAHVSSQHHVIPEGEQYLDLFRGEYSPIIINNLHVLKNKSAPPANAMIARSDDMELGFQIPVNENDDEYKEDAEECAKFILSTYPGENRRKRRRH